MTKMRDTAFGADAAADAAAGACTVGAGVAVGAMDSEARSRRGVLRGRLDACWGASSMGSAWQVAPCVMQLVHEGFSALHLICRLQRQAPLSARHKGTNLSSAAERAGLGGPLARTARFSRVITCVSGAHRSNCLSDVKTKKMCWLPIGRERDEKSCRGYQHKLCKSRGNRPRPTRHPAIRDSFGKSFSHLPVGVELGSIRTQQSLRHTLFFSSVFGYFVIDRLHAHNPTPAMGCIYCYYY